MSDWKQGFYEAIKNYLELPEDAKVYSVVEQTGYTGACETCYYEYQEIVISYSLDNGTNVEEIISMSMSDFMNQI